MSGYRALAPAKVNLGLFVGPARTSDGRHQLVTVMQSISLADELRLTPAAAGAAEDEVSCPAVPGPPGTNLAAAALRSFRSATGWDAPPVRLEIAKRVPLAAGLGGGSADAAATLRLARHTSGLGDEELLRELGAALGADVPALLTPGRWLAAGAGERLHRLPDPSPPLELLLLPLASELSTASVYAEADRLGPGREPDELVERYQQLLAAFGRGAPLPDDEQLLVNDLQPAAVSLCPPVAEALTAARTAGAEHVLVSGSGPTVVGLFERTRPCSRAAPGPAERAAARLRGRMPAPICATSVGAAGASIAGDGRRRGR
jgi:4-diphosphocytidyl-2-C-methyl-D-erythritol kinase